MLQISSGVVLDPSRPRENLPELLLRHAANVSIVIEDDRARTGRALIEREDMLRGHAAVLLRRPGGVEGPLDLADGRCGIGEGSAARHRPARELGVDHFPFLDIVAMLAAPV